MPEYRFYTIKRNGRIAGPPIDYKLPDDDGAVKEAKKLLGGHAIEIWQGARVVAQSIPTDFGASDRLEARLGLKTSQQWTPYDEEELRRMASRGYSKMLIAAKLKRTIGAVKSHSSRLGIKIRPGRRLRAPHL
jgi:hypothetical protein